MSNILDRLVQLESDILYKIPPEPGETEFSYNSGDIPVLLSAPHGAVHTRDGNLKDEDEYTAAFTRLIAEMTGAHVLYACRKSGTDPNWYPDVPYKQKLKEIVGSARIGFVLDIHGSSSRHNFGLALGTMADQSCPDHRDQILASLRESQFSEDLPGLSRLDVDRAFKGAGDHEHETVTRFAWRNLATPAAQFELNADLRIVERIPGASLPEPFHGSPEDIEKTVFAFSKLVRALSI